MEIKLRDIIQAQRSYDELMSTKMPPKAAYWLMRSGRVIEREIKNFTETRDRVIKEMGEQGDEADTFKIPPNKLDEFTIQMDELLNVIVEVNIKPLTIDMVETGFDSISPRVLIDCWFLFDE